MASKRPIKRERPMPVASQKIRRTSEVPSEFQQMMSAMERIEAKLDVMQNNLRALHLLAKHNLLMQPIIRGIGDKVGMDSCDLAGPSLTKEQILDLTRFEEFPASDDQLEEPYMEEDGEEEEEE